MALMVRGWRVCRFYGVGSGAPTGRGNSNYSHGLRFREYCEIQHPDRGVKTYAKLLSKVGEIDFYLTEFEWI